MARRARSGRSLGGGPERGESPRFRNRRGRGIRRGPNLLPKPWFRTTLIALSAAPLAGATRPAWRDLSRADFGGDPLRSNDPGLAGSIPFRTALGGGSGRRVETSWRSPSHSESLSAATGSRFAASRSTFGMSRGHSAGWVREVKRITRESRLAPVAGWSAGA